MSERMQRLAQFCVDTRFEDLPPALVAQAKRHILDTFGATLAGADSDVAKQARQVFDGEVGSTLIWGTDQRTGAAQAAMLNGCLLYTSPSPRDLSTSRMPSSA